MELYSNAARCRECGMKASLNEPGAHALARLAGLAGTARDSLEVFRCPDGHGWHLRRADGGR